VSRCSSLQYQIGNDTCGYATVVFHVCSRESALAHLTTSSRGGGCDTAVDSSEECSVLVGFVFHTSDRVCVLQFNVQEEVESINRQMATAVDGTWGELFSMRKIVVIGVGSMAVQQVTHTRTLSSI